MQSMNFLSDKKNVVHLVGIGGVSMNALAEAISAYGLIVRGSDMNMGVYAKRLAAKGIEIIKGHFAENVEGADVVIRTSAIKDDNPEIVRARELGIPVLERTEAWGLLMEKFPEVMIGADMREIGGVFRISDGDLFIAEACEYCNSFLNFNPTIAVVLNVEEDHLDFFSGIDDIINSFANFLKNVKPGGKIVINGDDENARSAAELSGREFITFGLSESCDVRASDIVYKNGYPTFSLINGNEKVTEIRLSVLGEHNIKNALAASAVAISMGINAEDIVKALSSFTGVGRRMEYKGEFRGVPVFDDYAHHPSEIETTLNAVRKAHQGRIICVFQPHTYTRTAALKDDFARALSLADKVILADIFAAREQNTIGIDSSAIGDKMTNAECISGFENIKLRLSKIVTGGDFVLTMGAGDIYKVGEMLVSEKE